VIPFCETINSDSQDSSILASYIREIYTSCITEQLRSVIITVAIALLGVLLLRSAYSLIDTRWPEAYTSVDTHVNVHLRTNPMRTYLLFRGGPVFIVATFVSVSIDRVNGLVWTGFWLMTIVYLGSTTARAVRDMLVPPRHPNWPMLSIFHVLSVFVVISIGVTAVLLRSLFAPLIPAGQELLIAVWAGTFATVISCATRVILAPVRIEGAEVIRSIRKDVGNRAWRHLVDSTPHKGKFLSFAMAIVLAESQQRPRWFRRLERFGGKFRGAGTYGVSQVAADEPITDEESIDLMIQRLDKPEVHAALLEHTYPPEFYNICRSWNDDDNHAARIQSFYEQVTYLREISDELD